MQFELENKRQILEMRVIELSHSARRREVICIERYADALDNRLQAVEREAAVRNLENQSSRLQEARAALRRIEDGTYGICVECDEPIRPARLAALPWAALCIRCQQEADCRCGANNQRTALAMAA